MGCAHPDGRRSGAARGRVPSDRNRAPPGHHDAWALRQEPVVQPRLADPVQRPDDRLARSARTQLGPLSRLGDGRSRKMGAGRLCVPARRCARLGPVARLPQSLLAARDRRLCRVHRMGGRPGLVGRQGRPQRHLLLCDHPMAGRGAPAASSGGGLCLGGRGRFLPRSDAPRRDAFDILGDPCAAADLARPAWPGRAWSRQRVERRPRQRRHYVERRGARREPHRLRRRDPAARARGRVSPRSFGRLEQGHRALPLGRELGWPGPPRARQFRSVRAGRLVREVSRSAWLRALDDLLHRLRSRNAAPLLRQLSQGARHLVRPAARAAAGAPSGREIRRTQGRGLAVTSDRMDALLPRGGGGKPVAHRAFGFGRGHI